MNTTDLIIVSIPFAISILSQIIALKARADNEKKFEEALREIKALRDEYMMGRIDVAASGAIFKAKKDIEDITFVNEPLSKLNLPKPKRRHNA